MGVAEHLKTLCCLGLPPESATIAVSSLLHELLPHGWSRIALLEPDATIGSCYPENQRRRRFSASVCGGSLMTH